MNHAIKWPTPTTYVSPRPTGTPRLAWVMAQLGPNLLHEATAVRIESWDVESVTVEIEYSDGGRAVASVRF